MYRAMSTSAVPVQTLNTSQSNDMTIMKCFVLMILVINKQPVLDVSPVSGTASEISSRLGFLSCKESHERNIS